jgi:hypothetical protein
MGAAFFCHKLAKRWPFRPTWAFDFRRGVIPAGATFTRASAGSYFNSAGVMVSASSNVARFDYDPVTLAPLGYLAEMQSTNLFLRSGDFSNASWSKVSLTVNGNSVAAPDGTTTAAQFVEVAANNNHFAYQGITMASDTFFGVSCFFKAGTKSFLYINVQNGINAGNWCTAVFNIASGATTASQTGTGATSGTIQSTYVQPVGNGWYRCSMICKVSVANPFATFAFAQAASGISFNAFGENPFLGDTGNNAYAWGAQADTAGVGVTSYIPTAGATATRSQDFLSLPLTALPGWNGSQGGVLVAAYRLHTKTPNTATIDQTVAYMNAGVSNSIRFLGRLRNSDVSLFERNSTGGGSGISLQIANAAEFVRMKSAFGWAANHVAAARDGGTLSTNNTLGALPVGMTTLDFQYFTGSLNGTIESIAYYRGDRPDAFVQQVSR